MTVGIYKIYNTLTSKIYIGQSINIERRLKAHLNSLNKNKHYNKHLQNSFNKYKEFFIFETIECCLYTTEDYINEREEYWITLYNSCDINQGFNLSRGGHKRYLYPYCVISTCKRDKSGNKNPFFGKIMSSEQKHILSEKAKQRAKTRPNNFLGRKHSKESKLIISQKAKARYITGKTNCENPTVFLWLNKSGEQFIGTRRDLLRKLRADNIKASSSSLKIIIDFPGRVCKGWYLDICSIKAVN